MQFAMHTSLTAPSSDKTTHDKPKFRSCLSAAPVNSSWDWIDKLANSSWDWIPKEDNGTGSADKVTTTFGSNSNEGAACELAPSEQRAASPNEADGPST